MSENPLRAFDGIVRTLSVDGASAGSLVGATFVAKDLYDIRGYATGAGNPDWERTHAIPIEDGVRDRATPGRGRETRRQIMHG